MQLGSESPSRLIHVANGLATACGRWMCEDVTTSSDLKDVTCAKCRQSAPQSTDAANIAA